MARQELPEERLTHSVIGAFFDVYNSLGFGFLEHVYVMALERELRERGHRVAHELCVRVEYKGQELCTQRLDMVVDDRLVVETKSTYVLHKAAPRQLFSYLKLRSRWPGFVTIHRRTSGTADVCPHRSCSSCVGTTDGLAHSSTFPHPHPG